MMFCVQTGNWVLGIRAFAEKSTLPTATERRTSRHVSNPSLLSSTRGYVLSDVGMLTSTIFTALPKTPIGSSYLMPNVFHVMPSNIICTQENNIVKPSNIIDIGMIASLNTLLISKSTRLLHMLIVLCFQKRLLSSNITYLSKAFLVPLYNHFSTLLYSYSILSTMLGQQCNLPHSSTKAVP